MTPTNDGPPGDDRPSFKEAMKRVIAERRKAAGPHPDLDTLSAYAAGELPEPEAERVRDHLALCAACTGTVLDLSILAGRHEVAEVGELSDADEDEQLSTERAPELEAAWSDMRARLERERLVGGRETPRPPASPAPPVAPVVEMPRRPERVYDAPNVRLPWAIAAVLAAACVGLGIWGLAVSAQRRELTRPRAVTFAEVVSPDDEESRVRGSSGAGEQVSSARGGGVAFVLPDSTAGQPAFRVEIRPVAGGEPEVIENVPSQDGRDLRLLFPAGSLSPGLYEALVSPAGAGAEPLRYPFEVGP